MAEKQQEQATVEVAKDPETPSSGPIEATTKGDALDLGVAQVEGEPTEPVGPEDAFGAGPKRGDYSERIGDNQLHYTSTVVEGRGVAVLQNPRASDQGNPDPEHKGGVTGPAHDKAEQEEAKAAAQEAEGS